MKYELIRAISEVDLRDYHKIRREILWEARGRNNYNDKHPDEYLPDNHPLLLKLNDRAIGTTRLDNLRNGTGIVRRVAIVADIQRAGHGRVMSAMVEDYARNLGIKTFFVNAAEDAVIFYQKTGWEFHEWNREELVGIASDCMQMKKAIL